MRIQFLLDILSVFNVRLTWSQHFGCFFFAPYLKASLIISKDLMMRMFLYVSAPAERPLVRYQMTGGLSVLIAVKFLWLWTQCTPFVLRTCYMLFTIGYYQPGMEHSQARNVLWWTGHWFQYQWQLANLSVCPQQCFYSKHKVYKDALDDDLSRAMLARGWTWISEWSC